MNTFLMSVLFMCQTASGTTSPMCVYQMIECLADKPPSDNSLEICIEQVDPKYLENGKKQ